MSGLRILGALALVGCGWCTGGAVQAKIAAHEAALRRCIELLRRVRQEVAYRRTDLGVLSEELQREGLLPPGSALQTLAAPPELAKPEAACFAACFSQLGRAGAQQECERLDYYAQRLEAYLRAAQSRTQSAAALCRRLGLAAGAVLALLFL